MKNELSILVKNFLKGNKYYYQNTNDFSSIKKKIFFETLSQSIKILFRPWSRRNQKHIKENYSIMWSNISLEEQLNIKNLVPHYYKDKIYLIYPHLVKKIYLHYLYNFIKRFNPKNVLEIGSGNGVNLFSLSAVSDCDYCGIELTRGGVSAAQKIQAEKFLPEFIKNFTDFENFKYNSNFKNIKFMQKNAKEFELDEKFDFIFSALALEQMNEIKVEVLRNIRRHASSIVVFIEPFDEFNKTITRKLWIKSQNYFNLSYKKLNEYGFEILEVIDDFPSKLTLGVGIVIARVK